MAAPRPGGIYHEVKQVLIEHDPVFAALEREKKLGWESKDVERLWQLRTEKLNLLSEARKGKDNKKAPHLVENPYATLAIDQEEEYEEDEDSKHLSVTGQKLIRAGKGPSYDKYYDFYRKLFESIPEHSKVFSLGNKRFVDIGCAPGGLCAYFIRDLGWSGIGFTLQIERGGLKVRFKDPNLHVFPCDMSDMESADYINGHVEGGSKYDFINCGVVMGKHQVESIGEDRETALQILRVNRNQFLSALKWLVHGGDLFWVFQSSSVGCWLYFLDKLQKSFKSISLFSTLVPSRSPVYALCTGFDADCDATKAWIKELESVTDFTDEHIDSWNVKTWEAAEPIINSLRTDLYKIWNTQREGLKEIREAASSQLEKEELLLKKLSGSRHDEAASLNQSANASIPSTNRKPHHKQHHERSDFDSDWRRGTGGADADGWVTQSSGTKPSRPDSRRNSGKSSGFRTSHVATSKADAEDSWRR
jgi:hypothetical protein